MPTERCAVLPGKAACSPASTRAPAARKPLLALVAALLALTCGGLALASPASARVATSGSGRFLDTIDWLEWGQPFQKISGKGTQTRTTTTSVAGADLVVTCSLSNFDGVAVAYRPGTWIGDALDDLYAIGGSGHLNTLTSGVATLGDFDHPVATFDFDCSAASDGRPLRLDGVVIADAEQSQKPERIEATVASSATWHVIDRLRSPICPDSTIGTRMDDGVTNTLRLTGSGPCETGPTAVAYARGATSGRVTVQAPAFGRAAAALGVLIPIDRSDAPVGYGEAAHLIAPALKDGELPGDDPVNVSEPDFELASLQAPPTRLGNSVDPGGEASDDGLGDDTAGADDAFGPPDDETDDPPALIAVQPGEPFTQPGVACTGPGLVASWIDFDASGSFDDDERSKTALCAGTSVDLTWAAVPDDVQALATTFERLRIAVDAGDVARPIGLAASGEVEDHALAIALGVPDEPLTIQATSEPGGEPTPAAPNSAATGSVASAIAQAVAPPPPDPELGESVAVAPSTGQVRVKVPGGAGYVDLAQATDVPLGSRIDTRAGRVTLTAEVDARTGATQTATFFSGIFVVTQTTGRKPVLRLKLAGGSFSGCSGRATSGRTALGARGGPIPFRFAARKRSKRKVRRLWGDGKGDFQTTGLRSSATVRGTNWLVEDRCDGTYTRVKRGTVDVRDYRLRKTIRLRAGKRYMYLAKAP